MESYIKQGDCLELMKEIPDGSIDMILCDLPYGTTSNKWDSIIPLEPLWKEYKRIIKDNGAICLFGQPPFTATLINSNLKMFRYEWIWQKSRATGFLNAKKMPMKAHEVISVFYKKLPTYNPQMRKGFKPYKYKQNTASSNYRPAIVGYVSENTNGEHYPIDILQFKSASISGEVYKKLAGGAVNLHPTQKPTDLLEYLIKTYTNEGEIVLDNCMGSGSTCVAAINTNRKYIGFELDEAYFFTAKQRIELTLNNKGE